MKKPKILFCDLDGTLIKTRSGKTFPQGMWDMELKLDVLKKIKEMSPEYVFIITNQGGIGQFFTEADFEKKLSYIEISIRDYIKHENFKAIDSIYCPTVDKNDKFRKPNTGMLEYMIKNYKLQFIPKTDMLMIGDASGKKGQFSDNDLMTAKNFKIDYIDVGDLQYKSFI